MKKVAIVTIKEQRPNYGNALQNYAVKVIMNKLGFQTETLYFEGNKREYKILFAKHFVQKISNYKLPGDTFYWHFCVYKIEKFYKFYKKYCPLRFIRSIDRLENKYDYFVVGSDQVWNPKWYDNNVLKKDMYLLTFAKPEQKICISPSFGVSKIPKEWMKFFSVQLNTFPYLSVREASGAEIIKKLTGRDAEVLIDPTLMLDKEEWDCIAKKPKRINTSVKYALTYFLGEVSAERHNDIETIIKKNKLAIFNLNDKKYPEFYTVDPGEFVYLISHAELILTDSFHACVFSFIYEKPFLAFEREGSENGMFSRIENLLGTFHLDGKYANSVLESDLFGCDYSEGKSELSKERSKMTRFLKASFGI